MRGRDDPTYHRTRTLLPHGGSYCCHYADTKLTTTFSRKRPRRNTTAGGETVQERTKEMRKQGEERAREEQQRAQGEMEEKKGEGSQFTEEQTSKAKKKMGI